MTLFYIVLLILFGLLFLVVELLLLPGISVGAVLALVSYGGAGYLAYCHYGPAGVGVAVAVVVVLSCIATAVSLRAKTWQRFTLRQEIRSSGMPLPETELHIGDRGTTLSRLSPMGRVRIGGRSYEAKSQNGYLDPGVAVEVTGFENFSVIVQLIN